jgi:hypothetical protein
MALILGCRRYSNSALAMMTPIPPRTRSPRAQLTTSPRTCMAMITTASLHPQTRCRNQPIPAVVRAAASMRKRIATAEPKGASCRYAAGFSAQTRSSAVPRHSNVVAARLDIVAPKKEEDADRSESRRLMPQGEIDANGTLVWHLLNIRQSANKCDADDCLSA